MSRVQRSYLTCVEGSLLACLFSGRWDECFLKDSNGGMSLDVDSEAFDAIRNAIFAGGEEAVEHLIKQAHNRNMKGAVRRVGRAKHLCLCICASFMMCVFTFSLHAGRLTLSTSSCCCRH